MLSILTPPKSNPEPDPSPGSQDRFSRRRRSPMEEEDLHLLLSELRDDNSRSRWREAVWVSIIIHMIMGFALFQAPKWFPGKDVTLVTPADQLRNNKDLTFLELPKSQPQVPPPDTNMISDQDRIAAARNPQIRKKDLDELLDARRQGAPGQSAQPPNPPQQLAQGAQQQNDNGQQRRPPVNDSNQFQPPRSAGSAFQLGNSAASAIEQAARASAQGRGGGLGGDYGMAPGSPNTAVRSDIDILSDTMGVDFGPYLQRVLQSVRTNWYNLIPEVARPPLLKQGRVTVEFLITKNGTVAGMRLAGPSGDVSLDRAAWGGITGSNPFPPLPSEFRGEYLALRFQFYYNPRRNEMQ